jgi:hypothetical protein
MRLGLGHGPDRAKDERRLPLADKRRSRLWIMKWRLKTRKAIPPAVATRPTAGRRNATIEADRNA